MKKIYTTLLQGALVLFCSTAFAQTTITVQDGESIQDAIDSSVEGDIIEVSEGTFDESLSINKNITVRGAGPFKTILTGGPNGSTTAYDQTRTILALSPFTLDGIGIVGPSRNVDQNHNSMGILLESYDNATIQNCRIEGHITGIYVSGSEGNLIENNIFQYCGNGILLAGFNQSAGSNIVRKNIFRNNGIANEDDDAGIKLISNYNGSSNLITENDIYENTFGINNQTTNVIDATSNYWGSSNGPFHSTTNPGGNGDEISDYVTYSNWTDAAFNGALAVEEIKSSKLTEARFFPNPADVEVTVAYELNSMANVQIQILDLQGRIVVNSQMQQLPAGLQQAAINTSALNAGFYFMNLMIDGESNTSPLMIE